MDVRGAVQPRTDGDVERRVEDAAEFRRGDGGVDEAERADATGVVAVPEHLTAQLVEGAPEPLDQGDLVRVDGLQAALLHEVNAGGKAGDAEDVGSAPLQEVGKLPGLRLARGVA